MRQIFTLDIIFLRELRHPNMRQIFKVCKNRCKRVKCKNHVPFYANFALFKLNRFFIFSPIPPYNGNNLTKNKNAWFVIEGVILCSRKKEHKLRTFVIGHGGEGNFEVYDYFCNLCNMRVIGAISTTILLFIFKKPALYVP